MFLDLSLYKSNQCMVEEKNISYQKEKNQIFFELEQMKHEIDLEKKLFTRFNKEFHFFLDIEQEKCTYELKEPHLKLDIMVDYAVWNQTSNDLEIEYEIETDDKKTRILIHFLN